MLWQRRWCEARAKTFRFKAQKIAFEQDERCSAFFFKSVKVASAKAVIPGLRGEDGVLRTEGRGMLEVATAFYRRLFSEQKVDEGMGDFFLKFLKARVPEAVRAVLELPISLEELTAALKGMKELEHKFQLFVRFWFGSMMRHLCVWDNAVPKAETMPRHYWHACKWSRRHAECMDPALIVAHRRLYGALRVKMGPVRPTGVARCVWMRLQPKGLGNRLKDLNWLMVLNRLPEVWAEAQVHFTVLQGLTVKGVLLGEGWQRMRFKDWVLVLLVLSLIKKGLWDARCASVRSNVEVGVKGIMGCVRAELRWRFWVEERKWGYHAAKEKWKLVLAGLP
ncbi:hypothetical protein SKAU_G00238300 [Synaphobranchus kaupii]|uniref:Uncharacterized protein n=1 Tax=Synaphobranchus kaupii TaxID=118154 RepID=A0A9Q1F724_SYNKA|nr:hypothetical protein SKAU_G00238300 [Synaphobranchus kaupii]